MANIIAATQEADTSSDIVITAGKTAVFSLVGSQVGDAIEIKKKDSTGAYWLMSEEVLPGSIKTAIITNTIRVRSITNNSISSITVQVFKPASGVASGVDQD